MGRLLHLRVNAAQSHQARPEEAQEPSWGTAKGGSAKGGALTIQGPSWGTAKGAL